MLSLLFGALLQIIGIFIKFSIELIFWIIGWIFKGIFILLTEHTLATLGVVLFVVGYMWLIGHFSGGSSVDSVYYDSYLDERKAEKERFSSVKDNIAKVETDFWGDETYYDSHGNKIGKGKRGVFGDVEIYDNSYNKMGKKTYNVFGDIEIYDNHYNRTNVGKRDLFGDMEYYDDKRNLVAKGTRDFFGDQKITRKDKK